MSPPKRPNKRYNTRSSQQKPNGTYRNQVDITERLFGSNSIFDEAFHTTKVDRTASRNPQVRGRKCDNSGLGDEDNRVTIISAAKSSSSASKKFIFNIHAPVFKPSAESTTPSATNAATTPASSATKKFQFNVHARPFIPASASIIAPMCPENEQRRFPITDHYEGLEECQDFGSQNHGYQYGGPGYSYRDHSYLLCGQMGMQGQTPMHQDSGQDYRCQYGGSEDSYRDHSYLPCGEMGMQGQTPMCQDTGSQYYGYQYGGSGYSYRDHSNLPCGQRGMQGPGPMYEDSGSQGYGYQYGIGGPGYSNGDRSYLPCGQMHMQGQGPHIFGSQGYGYQYGGPGHSYPNQSYPPWADGYAPGVWDHNI